jgi:hypothetical protein
MGQGMKEGFLTAVPCQRVLSASEKAASSLGIERHRAYHFESGKRSIQHVHTKSHLLKIRVIIGVQMGHQEKLATNGDDD